MWRRPLGDMLTEVSESALVHAFGRLPVQATSVELSLPIEIGMEEAGGEMTFIADVPIWRWRTDFDQVPGRLRITWVVGEE